MNGLGLLKASLTVNMRLEAEGIRRWVRPVAGSTL
jgi:hypothetical protein